MRGVQRMPVLNQTAVSLKTRMAFSVAALFILFVSCAAYATLAYFEHTFRETVATQQMALVSSLANTIDGELTIAQNALVTVALSVPPAAWSDPDTAQRFLDNRIALKSNFDSGVALFGTDGRLLAESPYRPGRCGQVLSLHEVVREALATGKPQISTAVTRTGPPGQPAVIMCVPVFDGQGQAIGLLEGRINMLGHNSLAKLADIKIGTGGYLYISDRNRVLIVHPDRGRIMKTGAPQGVNRFYDRAIGGFEGSGETVTQGGVRMISSCKRLQSTSWIVVANYPAAEAYAPLTTATRYFVAATTAGTAVLLCLTWLIMRRLMAPLAAMTRHVTHLPEKTGNERFLPETSHDEIGTLVSAFNAMLRTMDRHQESLKEREERFRLMSGMLEQEVAKRQQAQEILAFKQQQLGALNASLEARIAGAVQELRQKDQMLIQQSRLAAMGEMINNIAHQWRQPLNNVALIIQNLQYGFEAGELTAEEMKSEVALAMETIQFMSRTIDDFRNFTRYDKKTCCFSIHEAVTRTLGIISAGLRNNGIAVIFEDQAELDVTAVGFPNEFAQALLNVLTNAKDVLLERRSPDPRIKVRIFREGDRSVVTVADNGGGIDESILPKIFDPYFSTKEPGKGTGLGLYMSKMIIEKNMGGSLTVRTADGGSEFRIEVPSG
jgi:signal transduction histidine kinase